MLSLAIYEEDFNFQVVVNTLRAVGFIVINSLGQEIYLERRSVVALTYQPVNVAQEGKIVELKVVK
jgi:hypothetical protein